MIRVPNSTPIVCGQSDTTKASELVKHAASCRHTLLLGELMQEAGLAHAHVCRCERESDETQRLTANDDVLEDIRVVVRRRHVELLRGESEF